MAWWWPGRGLAGWLRGLCANTAHCQFKLSCCGLDLRPTCGDVSPTGGVLGLGTSALYLCEMRVCFHDSTLACRLQACKHTGCIRAVYMQVCGANATGIDANLMHFYGKQPGHEQLATADTRVALAAPVHPRTPATAPHPHPPLLPEPSP